MLEKKYRFHGLGALNFVYRRGASARSGPLSLRYVLNKRQSNFRFAVVVAKKVEKSAVRRNRIRRRLLAAFEPLKGKIPAKYDLVLSVYDSKVSELPFEELQSHISQMLKKAQIL